MVLSSATTVTPSKAKTPFWKRALKCALAFPGGGGRIWARAMSSSHAGVRGCWTQFRAPSSSRTTGCSGSGAPLSVVAEGSVSITRAAGVPSVTHTSSAACPSALWAMETWGRGGGSKRAEGVGGTGAQFWGINVRG